MENTWIFGHFGRYFNQVSSAAFPVNVAGTNSQEIKLLHAKGLSKDHNIVDYGIIVLKST